MEVKLHTFLTLVLDGGEWSTLRPGSLTPRESATCTQWTGGWVCPRDGVKAVEK